MVTAVSNLGRSGLYDWLVQRVSAVVLLAYVIFIVAVLMGGELQYAEWKALFAQTWVRVFSLGALLSLVLHAWIGLWSVSTDYLTERLMGTTGNVLRGLFQFGTLALLFTYVVWGIQILWS
ncbi:MAG TPA: succinate dehydrogenase, hydrophobic membrane anchor protein [Spongiibacteraceae bacterium]|jgi:succinate dehydrogenase / fumarate reductase membrane anchor subunit|nr:succinate dehydrogenase, hydrophobic membrane anchor protein [Spongiibacteraceae bacterium]HUH37278.1 succinate dehydrogenase, hydrophobic membrane anchor protein [Spongiibacteraceae bacterium]